MDNSKNTREDFVDTASDPSTWVFPKTVPELQDTIYKIYKIDVLAIKNLVFLAQKLQTDGITIPSKSYFKDQIQVSAEDPASNLRVGSVWKIPGIYNESGDIVVGSTANIFIGKCSADGPANFNKGMKIDTNGNATFTGTIDSGNIKCGTIESGNIKCGTITSTAITGLDDRIKILEAKLTSIQNIKMIRMSRHWSHSNFQCKIVDDQNNNFKETDWVIGIVSSNLYRNSITFEGFQAYTYIKDGYWHVALAEFNRHTNANSIVIMWAIPKSLFSGTTSITDAHMNNWGNYNWS